MKKAIVNLLLIFIVWVSFLDKDNQTVFVNPTTVYAIKPAAIGITDKETGSMWVEHGSLIILNNNENVLVRGNTKQTLKKIKDALKKPQ